MKSPDVNDQLHRARTCKPRGIGPHWCTFVIILEHTHPHDERSLDRRTIKGKKGPVRRSCPKLLRAHIRRFTEMVQNNRDGSA